MHLLTLAARSVRAASRRISRFLDRDYVVLDRVRLPPAYLRSCGAHFRADSDFLRSSLEEADRLTDQFGVTAESRILDIGCGAGRLPIGLLQRLGSIEDYLGVDINPRAIDWCVRHLSTNQPALRFQHIKVANPRYRSGGPPLDESLALDAGERAFDLAYLHSVTFSFTHRDLTAYLKLLRRYLSPAGRVFMTAFVEEGVPPVTEKYPYQLPRGVRSVTVWESGHIRSAFIGEGFTIDRLELHTELDDQAAIHLSLS